MDEQAHSRVAPDVDEIGAGDEVVVLDGEGGISGLGILCDVDGEQAEVRVGDSVRKLPLTTVAHPDSPAAEACRSAGEAGSEAFTDPARLVEDQRYAITDLEHPERAGSVGDFDGIRPSDREGEEPEDYLYFRDGRIGNVPQGLFGFPVAQRHEFRLL
jgi:hypothetical protein